MIEITIIEITTIEITIIDITIVLAKTVSYMSNHSVCIVRIRMWACLRSYRKLRIVALASSPWFRRPSCLCICDDLVISPSNTWQIGASYKFTK